MNRVNEAEYENASLLLPWFVTGKLSQSEKNEIADVLDVSRAFQDELVQQTELAGMIQKDPEVLELVTISSQEKRLDDLMVRINQSSTEQQTSFMEGFLCKISQFFETLNASFSNHGLQAAFSLFIVAQVAIIAFVMNFSGSEVASIEHVGSEYKLQSAKEKKVVIAADEIVLTFQFSPHAEERSIKHLFQAINARIVVHSPNDSNYKVAVKGLKSDHEVNRLISDLEKRQLVVFVGRGISE